MRVVIVANGWLNHPVALQEGDLLVAADGGARHCLERGLTPTWVVGDLDSLDQEELAQLKAGGAEIVQYPTRKDYTDLELALQHALRLCAMEKEYPKGEERTVDEGHLSEILILAALGARWDQTIANLLLPARLPGVRVRLVDDAQEITYVRGGECIELLGSPGDTVSLIPLAGDVRGITTHNLEYPLSDEDLIFGSTLGISNVMLRERATIRVKEGLLLCTLIRRAENFGGDHPEGCKPLG